jgi:O-antigen/teichoic acid export membrane protein
MMSRVTAMMKEDNFLSLAGNMVIALFGIAGFSLLARSLSITEFGQWVLFVTTGAFIDMFRFGITSTAVVRYLSGAVEFVVARLIS